MGRKKKIKGGLCVLAFSFNVRFLWTSWANRFKNAKILGFDRKPARKGVILNARDLETKRKEKKINSWSGREWGDLKSRSIETMDGSLEV